MTPSAMPILDPKYRPFPRQTVPWDLVEPHRRQAMANHSQTLERLAERGGLSWPELLAVIEDRAWHKIDAAAAQARVRAIAAERGLAIAPPRSD